MVFSIQMHKSNNNNSASYLWGNTLHAHWNMMEIGSSSSSTVRIVPPLFNLVMVMVIVVLPSSMIFDQSSLACNYFHSRNRAIYAKLVLLWSQRYSALNKLKKVQFDFQYLIIQTSSDNTHTPTKFKCCLDNDWIAHNQYVYPSIYYSQSHFIFHFLFDSFFIRYYICVPVVTSRITSQNSVGWFFSTLGENNNNNNKKNK